MEGIKTYEVPEGLRGNTYIDEAEYLRLYQESVSDPEGFWERQARETLSWFRDWSKTLDWDYQEARIRWFEGGQINVCHNCVDRHLPERASQTALIWEGNEPGSTASFTYAELKERVCRMASVLRNNGVGRGDRVAIYMPMVPEVVFAMLACARIGAIHSVIFAGFSANAIRDRVLDSSCKLLITSNEGLRGDKRVPLKETVDRALEGVGCVRTVLVHRRTDFSPRMDASRDKWLDEELERSTTEIDPESMNSEDPLFILYTSGSTGKPKGVLHTQAGYLLYASLTHKYVFDYRPGDIYFCAADVGWITGHSYIVYGPLANGATTLMFESTPMYPDAGRYWDVVERHKVNVFYTAPTAIRAIAKEGDDYVTRYDRSSLRILGTVGEPINADAWEWYFHTVGEDRCSVVDTWWQTETGGIMISPLPGVTKLKPGSAARPFFGIQPCVVDDNGTELEGNGVTGKLCVKFPWPGQMRTVYGDHRRFVETYFRMFPGKYFTGDACRRDEDGYYWITGRVDDVLNVAGHRIGTAEIESAIVSSGVVSEAAVVGMPHEVKGTGIFVYCIPRDGATPQEEVEQKVNAAIRDSIGAIAAPDHVEIVVGLPKTRSGKIMRRILRKIAEGERQDFGDTSTLADPQVVSEILKNLR